MIARLTKWITLGHNICRLLLPGSGTNTVVPAVIDEGDPSLILDPYTVAAET